MFDNTLFSFIIFQFFPNISVYGSYNWPEFMLVFKHNKNLASHKSATYCK